MSDNEDASSDDEDAHRKKGPSKPVPAWASKESLEAALRKQFGDAPNLNPDDIFGEVFTCDLEAIFQNRKQRYHRRTSSGNWAADKLTDKERKEYAKLKPAPGGR